MVVVSIEKIEMDLFWPNAPDRNTQVEDKIEKLACVFFVKTLSLPLVYVMIIQYKNDLFHKNVAELQRRECV